MQLLYISVSESLKGQNLKYPKNITMGLSHWTVKTILLLSHIALVYGNRVRHTETDSDPNNLSDNELLSRVQSEILSNLGLNEAPRISSVIPEEARQVLIQDAELEEDQDKHFMEDQSNVLLLARKGTQTIAHLPPNMLLMIPSKFLVFSIITKKSGLL